MARDHELIGELGEAELERFARVLEEREKVALDELYRQAMKNPDDSYLGRVLRCAGEVNNVRRLLAVLRGEQDARRRSASD